MDEKPKPMKAPILTHLALILIAVISITSATFALGLFGHFFQAHGNPMEGRSIVFASFAINSMVYIFAYRSMHRPIWRMNKLSDNKPLVWAVLGGLLTALIAFWIPGLRKLLGIVPLGLSDWMWIIGIALSLLVIVEVAKAISVRFHPSD